MLTSPTTSRTQEFDGSASRLALQCAKIPILGRLLVGREGEGLFAVTYTMKGDLKDPRVVVNPLSALAPGFLRRMFFIGEPGAEGRPRDPDEGPG